MTHHRSPVATILLLLLLSSLTVAAEQPPDEPGPRPKLVLVLSGGGARGVAHVGVLKVLEELHVVPDMVIGTSMGAIVGGLYAAGWTPEQIESLIQRIDWDAVFTDAVPRSEKSFRRKQDDRPVLIQGRLAFDGFKPVLPTGVIRGQRLEIILRILEALSPAASDFNRLPIPYRAVTADIITGEAVVLDSGSLATAMRASMSIPGVFPPVRYNGRDLVDGGITANLPVGLARRLGAEAIIAVDISTRLAEPGKELASFAAIVNHLNSLLTAGNVSRDRRLIRSGDLLITPELGDISFISFDRVAEAARIGEEAAREHAEELRRFSASDERWQEFSRRPRARSREQLQIDSIRIVNTSRVDGRVVRDALEIEPPAALDPEPFGYSLLDLYNTRYFGTIDFHLEEHDGMRELVVTTPSPDRGRGSLQFGVDFLDDLEGGSGYQLLARHQLLPANRRGGEWQSVLQIGTESVAGTEFYQPLDSAMRWFVVPRIEFRRSMLDLWLDGQPVVEYRLDTARASIAAGRVLGSWGELRASTFYTDVYGEPRIGDPLFPSDDERRGGVDVGFRVDTVDEVAFPRRGAEVEIGYTTSSSALGSEVDINRAWATAGHAWSFGSLTLTPYFEYGENLDHTLDLLDYFPLGGFGRLSGLGENELLGERLALARLAAYWRLFGLDLAGLKVRLYTGMSLEAGNVYTLDDPLTADSLLTGGSIWVGAMTPFGPARVAWGLAEGGRDRIYVLIGDRF
jgi:NTE family protein